MYAQAGVRPNARQAVGNPRPLKTAKDGAAFYNRVGVVKTHFERPKDFGFSFVEDFGVALFCS